MPTFYRYTQGGVVYSFDDVFVPADAFRQGNLWTWGNNSQGNLGTNNTTNRSTPVTTFAGGANWKQVAGGGGVVAAIKTDGTLWVWGNNSYGQLGDNTTTNRSTPVTTFAGGTNWKQVTTGATSTLAIKTDGTLWGWGRNTSSQLGDNTGTNRLTPVTTFSGGTNWKQVAGGYSTTAAIKTDGTLWTWGKGTGGATGNNTTSFALTPITTFAGGANWKQVNITNGFSNGPIHVLAVKTDGTLWTWGDNSRGQLGDNTTTNRLTPVTTFVGGNNWKSVCFGMRMSSAAIKTDGTLWTWGNNNVGQLGILDSGATTGRTTPVTTFAGGTNWKKISAGGGGALSNGELMGTIKTDGTLWVWGYNAYGGPLGINRDAFEIIPTPVTTFAGGTNWKEVTVGSGANYNPYTAAITYIDDYV